MSEVLESNEIIDVPTVARKVTYHPKNRLEQFRALPPETRSAVFNILSASVRQDLLGELSFNEAVELLDYLDPRRVHYILSRIRDKKRRERLIGRIKTERYEKIEFFLRFHPHASAALIHLNYVFVASDTTIGETASIIEDHLKNTGKTPAILVHQDGALEGEVSLGTLVRERNNSKLKHFVHPVSTLLYNTDSEKVMSTFLSTPHQKVVVLDSDGSILGVVFSDDVIDLLESQPAGSLYNFAGVEGSERPFDGVWDKVSGRYRWLLINLATCFLAAGAVSLFDDIIARYVTLAIFMPIVAGMGGNASTQTLAVMVRGIAIGEISLKNSYPAICREVLAGIVDGILTGTMMLPVAYFLNLNMGIAIVAAVAVVLNFIVAGFFGAFVPLLLHYFGKDPATSAGILISTATDVCGFLFLLGLADFFLF